MNWIERVGSFLQTGPTKTTIYILALSDSSGLQEAGLKHKKFLPPVAEQQHG
jgi:hypothetical protein